MSENGPSCGEPVSPFPNLFMHLGFRWRLNRLRVVISVSRSWTFVIRRGVLIFCLWIVRVDVLDLILKRVISVAEIVPAVVVHDARLAPPEYRASTARLSTPARHDLLDKPNGVKQEGCVTGGPAHTAQIVQECVWSCESKAASSSRQLTPVFVIAR